MKMKMNVNKSFIYLKRKTSLEILYGVYDDNIAIQSVDNENKNKRNDGIYKKIEVKILKVKHIQ